MGYSYGRTPAGRQGLACDNCGQVGGVRKRTCPYKVREDGTALPFCIPPALCAPCFKAEKGKTHAKCAQGAAAAQEAADRKQARLDAGELLVRSAESGPSKGVTKFWVSGKDGGREVAYLVATDVYRERHREARGGFFLADVPGAVPAECDHQPGQPACETFACGGTPPITTPLRNVYDVSAEPHPTECGADQTVRDIARAVEARTGLTVSAMRAADNGWADVNPGGRKINAWDFKAGTAHVRVLTYEARHALSRDPLRYAAVYVGQTVAAGAIDMDRRPAAWMGEMVRAVAPLVEGLHDALQVATPAPIQGWLLKNPILGANVEHSGLGLVEVVESREDGHTLVVKDALGRDHYLDRWGNGWWKVYPGGAALGGVDTPERFRRRIAYRDHVIEYRHAKLAHAITTPAGDCRTCLDEVNGSAEPGTRHLFGRYVRLPWCLVCGVPATLSEKAAQPCLGVPDDADALDDATSAAIGGKPEAAPAEPEVDRAQVAGDMFERVSQALMANDLDTAEKMVDAGEEYMPDFQPPGYGRWRYVRDEIAERRRVRKVNPRAYTAPAPEPEAEPEPWGDPNAEYAVGDRVTVLSGWQQEVSAGVVAEVTRFDEHVVYTVNIPARAAAFLGAEKMRPDPTPAPKVGQVWVSDKTGTRVKVTGVEPLSAVAHTDNLGDVILASPNWRPATDADLEPEPEPARPDPWGPALRALGVTAGSR